MRQKKTVSKIKLCRLGKVEYKIKWKSRLKVKIDSDRSNDSEMRNDVLYRKWKKGKSETEKPHSFFQMRFSMLHSMLQPPVDLKATRRQI